MNVCGHVIFFVHPPWDLHWRHAWVFVTGLRRQTRMRTGGGVAFDVVEFYLSVCLSVRLSGNNISNVLSL